MTFNSSWKALKSLSFYCYICQPRTRGLQQRFNLNMTAHMRTLLGSNKQRTGMFTPPWRHLSAISPFIGECILESAGLNTESFHRHVWIRKTSLYCLLCGCPWPQEARGTIENDHLNLWCVQGQMGGQGRWASSSSTPSASSYHTRTGVEPSLSSH